MAIERKPPRFDEGEEARLRGGLKAYVNKSTANLLPIEAEGYQPLITHYLQRAAGQLYSVALRIVAGARGLVIRKVTFFFLGRPQ